MSAAFWYKNFYKAGSLSRVCLCVCILLKRNSLEPQNAVFSRILCSAEFF